MNDTRHIRGPFPRAFAALPACAAAALLLAGCSGEDGNRAGRGLLPPYAESETALSDTVLVGTVEELDYQIGSHQTPSDGSLRLPVLAEPGMGSRALIRFGTLPVAGTPLVGARIRVSASFVSDPPPRLRIYQLLQGFRSGFEGDEPFPAFVAEAIAEGVLTPALGDTAAQFLFSGAAVDSLAQRWVEVTHVNAGLLFALAPGDSGRIELYSRDSGVRDPEVRPLIEIFAGDESGADTLKIVAGEDTFLSARTDASLAGRAGRLTIARGVAARSLMRFPVAAALGSRVIHQAFLALAVDTAATQVRAAAAAADTALVTAELVTEYPWNGEDTGADNDVDGRARLSPDSTVLRVDVTDLVRRWVQGPSADLGLRLRFVNEGFGVDWARFHASSEADTLRPRLEVIYSLPPGAMP